MILRKTLDLTCYKLIVAHIEEGFDEAWHYEVQFDNNGAPLWQDGNRFLREELSTEELSALSEEIVTYDDNQVF